MDTSKYDKLAETLKLIDAQICDERAKAKERIDRLCKKREKLVSQQSEFLVKAMEGIPPEQVLMAIKQLKAN